MRSISWRDLCPWLSLFRIFRISVSLQVLLLGFLGAWTMTVGWQMAGSLLLNEDSLRHPSIQAVVAATFRWPGMVATRSNAASPQASAASVSPSTPGVDDTSDDVASENDTTASDTTASATAGGIGVGSGVEGDTNPSQPQVAAGRLAVPQRILLNFQLPDGSPLAAVDALVVPVRALMVGGLGWRGQLFCGLGTLWNLIVWGILGGAITRVAVVRLGRDERVGLRESLMFASAKFASYIGGPLLPLVTIVVLAIPLVVLGFLMRLNLGVILAGLLWIPAGVLGFTMALFAIGVLFGWPLMWAAISAEGSDAFDGISRAFAYTFQRPLHYLCYAAIAIILGLLGAIIVQIACVLIVQFTTLPAVMGMGIERFGQIREALAIDSSESSSLLWFGAALIRFFNSCFLGIQRGYAFSFLWVASACIYLLLRRDADQTELDAIFLEDVKTDDYGLPQLAVDPVSGAPTIDDTTAQPTTAGEATSETDSRVANDETASDETNDDEPPKPSGATE